MKFNTQNKISLHSKAKINLSLDVLGKRPDGYHDVRMIMQSLAFGDDVEISLTPNDKEIIIECGARYVPTDSRNIAYKAAQLIFDKYYNMTKGFGVSISILKRIPVAAGLAGGSGNAACVLIGMNKLFNLKLNKDKLMELGFTLGADVPYCICNGTVLAEGIGERLSALPALNNIPVVLVNPGIPLSTAKIYGAIDLAESVVHPDTSLLINYIRKRNISGLANNMRNVMEAAAIPICPEIQIIKDKLLSAGAIGSMMSGSGPTVFGIFPTFKKAVSACESFKGTKYRAFYTKMVR